MDLNGEGPEFLPEPSPGALPYRGEGYSLGTGFITSQSAEFLEVYNGTTRVKHGDYGWALPVVPEGG